MIFFVRRILVSFLVHMAFATLITRTQKEAHMPFLRVELTPDIARQLVQLAVEDLRANQSEAEWLLQDAIRKAAKRLAKRRQREAAGVQAQAQAGAETAQVATAAGGA